MDELDVATSELDTAAEAARASAARPPSMSRSTAALAGVLAIADPIKPSAEAAIAALRAEGLRIVMLTGDNRDNRACGRLASSASTRSRPAFCRSARAKWCSAFASKAAASPWSATASTTRRRWPRPMSASRWAAARMSRSRAPASRCSPAISPAWCGRGACRRATMRNIRQNLALRLRLQRRRRADRGGRALSGLRHSAVADDRRGRDGAVIRQRDRQRAAADRASRLSKAQPALFALIRPVGADETRQRSIRFRRDSLPE